MLRTREKIRVFLLESNRLLSRAISTSSKRHQDLELYVYGRIVEGLDARVELQPDVILFDPNSRDSDGAEPIEMLKRNFPKSSIIVMNARLVQSEVVEYVRRGVSGFIVREAPFEDYLRTIRCVAGGEKILPPPLTGSLFSHISAGGFNGKERASIDQSRLTRREQEIVLFLNEGFSNKEIAQRLSIATPTVKSYVHSILEKLHVHTRLEIVHLVHQGMSK